MDEAFFPYGNKSKSFLIKRTLYLSNYLFKVKNVDKIILACNTLSLITLPFLKDIYKDKIMGVFELLPKDTEKMVYIATKNSCSVYDGFSYDATNLIEKIQKNLKVEDDIKMICHKFITYDKIILGCTHFILHKEKFRKYHNVISQDELFLLNEKNQKDKITLDVDK